MTNFSPSSQYSADLTTLVDLVRSSRRLVVLTGAGCSTESGIPDYRAQDGSWKRRQPMRIGEFTASASSRQRYWARNFLGWPRMAGARPNRAHEALSRLEAAGSIHYLITQNVDGLHQAAGSRKVVNLHGRVSRVICLDCGERMARPRLQELLAARNPGWNAHVHATAPDGDADVAAGDTATFNVVNCVHCDGRLKPDVVFFGENVPKERVGFCMDRIREADTLLVVGSSLMVWSGFRFARLASERNIPLAIVNMGRTRADDMASLKLEASCGATLTCLASLLTT